MSSRREKTRHIRFRTLNLPWSTYGHGQVTGRAAEDVVLFTGTGATGAVAKLVSALGLSGPLPQGLDQEER